MVNSFAFFAPSFAKNLEDVYELGDCIGAGSFSTVHLATHKTTGERYVSHNGKHEDFEIIQINFVLMNLLNYVISCGSV